MPSGDSPAGRVWTRSRSSSPRSSLKPELTLGEVDQLPTRPAVVTRTRYAFACGTPAPSKSATAGSGPARSFAVAPSGSPWWSSSPTSTSPAVASDTAMRSDSTALGAGARPMPKTPVLLGPKRGAGGSQEVVQAAGASVSERSGAA